MKRFMDKNFMLNSETAKKLYFDFAEGMPIYDYHCHLNPRQVAENKRFGNLTELWLSGDHYKWRAMRSCGIDEYYITGEADDYEKYTAWAKCMPYLIGNPLYHWTHLELQRFFGIDEPLCEESAEEIWNAANKQINADTFNVWEIFKKFNVKFVGTTDSPTDDLKYHIQYAQEKNETIMAPSFRPDPAINITAGGFENWVKLLAEAADTEISSFEDFLKALTGRMDFFARCGCKISDMAFEIPPYSECDLKTAAGIFEKALNGEKISSDDEEKYKTYIIVFFGKEYAKRGWAMQLHMNAIRNNNTKMFEKLGPDTGFDSVGDGSVALKLSKLLNAMNEENLLPKTILYSLNHRDNFVLGTMLGNFQSSEAKSKIQLGSGWWFNDQRDGMEEQIKCLANLGALSYFVGMLTDSRSFLSYPRHEYFRRILCNIIGGWVENGEYPYDRKYLEQIIKGICSENAKEYFGI